MSIQYNTIFLERGGMLVGYFIPYYGGGPMYQGLCLSLKFSVVSADSCHDPRNIPPPPPPPLPECGAAIHHADLAC